MKNRRIIQIFFFCLLFTLSIALFSQPEKKIVPENLSISSNGKFIYNAPNVNRPTVSKNGIYHCQYDIGQVSDETRELINFKFYEKDQLLFRLEKAPGSDLYISNSGYIAFMDMTFHFKNELSIHYYSKSGSFLFTEKFLGASLFGFSPRGNKFGVKADGKFYLISIPEHKKETYPSTDQFAISKDEKWVALAKQGEVRIYFNGKQKVELLTGFFYPRGISISAEHQIIAVIDKKSLKVFSLANFELVFEKKLLGKNSYRDLIIKNGAVLTGVHFRDKGISKGILRVYDLRGKLLLNNQGAEKKYQTFPKPEKLKNDALEYEEIPWPFFPFDSMRTVWNYYEQHMGGYGAYYSYLHQGLDLITPIGEPVYSCTEGIVKCVLTLGGAVYWRTAISSEQVSGYSDGWLYAHLIESTIQVDVGDTVHVHDYLGDIVRWTDEWGHIHFVKIRDVGEVWEYTDNEWGILFNPLLALRPANDLDPPFFEPVFENSKFAFCLNETSIYLHPDSLYGDVDIIAKVVDYVGDSEWQQPAYETFYWVKNIAEDLIVFPRTLGQRLNHSYEFYSGGNYEPYATQIYKRDELLIPSSWMSVERNYFHILTNNNGDSLIDLAEKDSSFSTTNFLDGEYRIFIEAKDAFGNSTVDSMDVYFRNGLTSVPHNTKNTMPDFTLHQNYPNPFNPATTFLYSLTKSGHVRLNIYDPLGRLVETLVDEIVNCGKHSVKFDAVDLSSGIYFYRLESGNFSVTRKMVLLH